MAFEKIISTLLILLNILGGSFSTYMPDKDINNHLFLVNRDYMISQDYVPNLVKVNMHNVTREFRVDMESPIKNLVKSAKSQGVSIHLVSGYRSYKKQNNVLESKLEKVKSEEKALEYVALPGSSEHQLGLAVDISYDNWQGLNVNFEKSKQGKWARNKAYDEGFIVRYLPDYVDITGYNYEPWHLRYIGIEHSKKIKELNEIPLEWYVSMLRINSYKDLLSISKQAKVWNYPIALQDLFSIYNSHEKDINDNKALPELNNAFNNMLNSASEESYSFKISHNYMNPKINYASGLLVSIQGEEDKKGFFNTKDYKWLVSNCDDYGFILRFPKGKEKLTNTAYTPDCFKYVGVNIAKYINKNKLCYEEFEKEWLATYQAYSSNSN